MDYTNSHDSINVNESVWQNDIAGLGIHALSYLLKVFYRDMSSISLGHAKYEGVLGDLSFYDDTPRENEMSKEKDCISYLNDRVLRSNVQGYYWNIMDLFSKVAEKSNNCASLKS